jgi:hypothetical protein
VPPGVNVPCGTHGNLETIRVRTSNDRSLHPGAEPESGPGAFVPFPSPGSLADHQARLGLAEAKVRGNGAAARRRSPGGPLGRRTTWRVARGAPPPPRPRRRRKPNPREAKLEDAKIQSPLFTQRSNYHYGSVPTATLTFSYTQCIWSTRTNPLFNTPPEGEQTTPIG